MSDFDYDIVATTDNKTIINGVYKLPKDVYTKEQLMSTLPVAYSKANTDKKLNTFENLCNADLLAFGSKIGQITNKGSAIFAMLPLYDKNSQEYKELEKRLVLIRVAQGDEIDKAKGVKVKEFPKHWTSYTNVDNLPKDTAEMCKVYNNIIIDKKPYFFKHRYKTDKREFDKYINGRENYCQITYGCSIDDLKQSSNKTQEQQKFIDSVDRFSPLIDTDCVMNNLSKYMEHFVKSILGSKSKPVLDTDIYKQYLHTPHEPINDKVYSKLKQIVLDYFKTLKEDSTTAYLKAQQPKDVKETKLNVEFDDLKRNIMRVRYEYNMSNYQLSDLLVILFYTDLTAKNKNVLWKLVGKYIYQSMFDKTRYYKYPVSVASFTDTQENPNQSSGKVLYLNNSYRLETVQLK